MRKNTELKKLKPIHFLPLTLAGIVNAFEVTFFLAPVKHYDSGISGLPMLLSQVTPPWLSLSMFRLVLNIPLFLSGLKKQGLKFAIYGSSRNPRRSLKTSRPKVAWLCHRRNGNEGKSRRMRRAHFTV